MSSFITTPNLPEERISLAAAGNYPAIISALHGMGIATVSLEDRNLPDEVSRHQDMLMCHTGGNKIFLSPDISPSPLTDEGFSVQTAEKLLFYYPDDVKLNVAVSRDFFIYNPKTADRTLINELLLSGRKGIETKQGYTKCSVCFVTENAVITEDPSIHKALQNTDVHVLLISKGDVLLSGAHYGFFGGATGKIDSTTLAVTGSLRYHSDGDIIKDFCRTHGVEIKELTDGRIIDIGGILPLIS